MTPMIGRVSVATIVLAMFYWGMTTGVTPTEAQPKEPAGDVHRHVAFSAVRCGQCHRGLSGEKDLDEPLIKEGVLKFIRLDEYRVWKGNDIHQFAFQNIVPNDKRGPNEQPNLGAKMQEVLRRDPLRGPKYEVARAAECLTCHSIDLTYNSQAHTAEKIQCDLMNDTDTSKARFLTTNGVSCEACHGFAENWMTPHAEANWRKLSPDDKLKKGLIDLRSPAVRAERCASCHVGNKDEGKFVTHDMYAAGHPPLPVFELATYSRQQPGHYHPYHKNEYFQDELKKPDGAKSVAERFHYRQGESQDAAFLAQGAAASFRASVKLLADDSAKLKEGELLDFSHFDCAACHHDLKIDSDRSNRTGGTPGRPLMRVQTDLFNLVVDSAGKKDRKEFDAQLQELKKAFDAQPFGNPKRIKESAGTLAKMVDPIVKELETVKYDAAGTRNLFEAVKKRIETAKNASPPGYIDYDTAQQLSWAMIVLRDEVAMLENKNEAKTIAAAQTKLGAVLFPYIRSVPFPVVPNPFIEPKDTKSVLESVVDRLPKRQEKQYLYKASTFFTEVGDLLKLPAP